MENIEHKHNIEEERANREEQREGPKIELTAEQQKQVEELVEALHNAPFLDAALQIKQELPNEVWTDARVQQAAKEGMVQCLAKGLIDNALRIKKEFNLPEEVVQQAAKEGMVQCLAKGLINDALRIKKEFNLPEEVVQQAAKEGMVRCLAEGRIDGALGIKGEFNLVPELPRSVIDLADIIPVVVTEKQGKTETRQQMEQKNWPPDIQERFQTIQKFCQENDFNKATALIQAYAQKDGILAQALTKLLASRMNNFPGLADERNKDVVRNLILAQEPALLNPKGKEVFGETDAENPLIALQDITNNLKDNNPELVGLIVLGSLSKGYWEKGSDLDWALVFNQEAAETKSQQQKTIPSSKINNITEQFRSSVEKAGISKLCYDHSFDFSRFTAGLDLEQMSRQAPLCNLFNGWFIGDRERLLKIQGTIAAKLTPEQWEGVRRGWVEHLSNYEKMMDRFGLDRDQVQFIINQRTLLWCPPDRNIMLERLKTITERAGKTASSKTKKTKGKQGEK